MDNIRPYPFGNKGHIRKALLIWAEWNGWYRWTHLIQVCLGFLTFSDKLNMESNSGYFLCGTTVFVLWGLAFDFCWVFHLVSLNIECHYRGRLFYPLFAIVKY